MDFLRSLPCELWPLIAGVLCGIFGYLLGRLSGGSGDDYKKELDACRRKSATLEADLSACNKKLSSIKAAPVAKATPAAASTTSSMASSFAAGAATTAAAKEATAKKETSTDSPKVDTDKTAVSKGISAVVFDAAAAKAAYGKKVVQDDLKVVEGIGPKIAELFHNHDINTWAGLAGTSVDRCQEILNTGGKRYEIHRPGTWPMQAELAALGKWSELKKWQDEHDYGKA